MIGARLGAGGMGEVWRARDTRLEREVAIKVLPRDFAESPQRRARFEREAKTISQLNHPNICTLYDVGLQDGVDYIVMELIEGESLAERLIADPLQINTVVRYGIEIAGALNAAHRKGIVHRDLKPGNVMLAKTGAKLLDFGLAKPGGVLSSSNESVSADSPTEQSPLTERGAIVGTFQYMSPEQLEGGQADARSDIFAFGALLYEMATGQRAFQAKNRTSLISAIVSGITPSIRDVVAGAPPLLDYVVGKCLAKDPDERWQSIYDVGEQLRWLAKEGTATQSPAVTRKVPARGMMVAWSAFFLALIAAGATFLGMFLARAPDTVMIRSSLLPPENTKLSIDAGTPVLSPDGTRIAFVAIGRDNTTTLWVRSLDGSGAQPLAGSEGAAFPFWSPDSRFLAFFSDGKLRKIDSSGGSPVVLCESPSGRGGAWTGADTILFTPSQTASVYVVSAAGGVADKVTELNEERGETSHRFPSMLPDGEHFLFLVEQHPQEGGSEEDFYLAIGSIESKTHEKLVVTNAAARYVSSGHLLFLRDRTLLAQRFDSRRLALQGAPVPVAENVSRTNRWEALFSASETGLLAFVAGALPEQSRLVWFDQTGRELGPVGRDASFRNVALSHDGTRAAVAILDPDAQTSDIWVLDLERELSTRVTFDADRDDILPVWSPDDEHVYFFSRRFFSSEIARTTSNGTGAREVVVREPSMRLLTSVTADGTLASIQGNDGNIALLDLVRGDVRAYLQTPFEETQPALSPDGKWIAYQSSESGRGEIYVQPLGDGGRKWQVSSDGGAWPRWLTGGTGIVWQSPDRRLMTADLRPGQRVSVSPQRPLFDPGMRAVFGYQYDVTSDGARFLVNKMIDQPLVPVTLVQHWTSQLAR